MRLIIAKNNLTSYKMYVCDNNRVIIENFFCYLSEDFNKRSLDPDLTEEDEKQLFKEVVIFYVKTLDVLKFQIKNF